jgi:hypothetical protein
MEESVTVLHHLLGELALSVWKTKPEGHCARHAGSHTPKMLHKFGWIIQQLDAHL